MVRPNGEEQLETQERILGAARQEFIAHGLRGARMQEIADRAQINKALLHYYFRDKESLYYAAIQSVAEGVIRNLQPVMETSSVRKNPRMLLENLVRAYILTLRNNPELTGMALRELCDGGTHLQPLLEGLSPLVQKAMSSIFPVPLQNTQAIPQFMINLMSMVWGTFLLQPMYTRILPQAGFALEANDAFYEARIQAIVSTLTPAWKSLA